jgi:hypothetical protein
VGAVQQVKQLWRHVPGCAVGGGESGRVTHEWWADAEERRVAVEPGEVLAIEVPASVGVQVLTVAGVAEYHGRHVRRGGWFERLVLAGVEVVGNPAPTRHEDTKLLGAESSHSAEAEHTVLRALAAHRPNVAVVHGQ